jgi:hypothetical protein
MATPQWPRAGASETISWSDSERRAWQAAFLGMIASGKDCEYEKVGNQQQQFVTINHN